MHIQCLTDLLDHHLITIICLINDEGRGIQHTECQYIALDFVWHDIISPSVMECQSQMSITHHSTGLWHRWRSGKRWDTAHAMKWRLCTSEKKKKKHTEVKYYSKINVKCFCHALKYWFLMMKTSKCCEFSLTIIKN